MVVGKDHRDRGHPPVDFTPSISEAVGRCTCDTDRTVWIVAVLHIRVSARTCQRNRAAQRICQVVVRFARRSAEKPFIHSTREQVRHDRGTIQLLDRIGAVVEEVRIRPHEGLRCTPFQWVVSEGSRAVVCGDQPIPRVPHVAIRAVVQRVAVQVIRHRRCAPLRQLVVRIIRRTGYRGGQPDAHMGRANKALSRHPNIDGGSRPGPPV